MPIESFSFDKGINLKKSPLLLEEGEMVSCKGFSFDHDGVLETRAPKTIGYAINTAGYINGFTRYANSLVTSSKSLCPGNQSYFNYIYQRDITDALWTNIDLMGGNTRPSFALYEQFIFAVDGESRRAFSDGNDYLWGIPNPSHAPGLTSGAAGNPSGDYYCYVTFRVFFPNGKEVETGPSPVSTITVVTSKIEWAGIPTSQYEGNVTIHRKLYRTVSGIAYLVATIPDNTTTTYSDNVTVATLQSAEVMSTDEYIPPPEGMEDLAVYLQRVFAIKDNALYWSEAYQPFNFTNDGNGVVTKEDENLVAIREWGDQLFIVSKERWYRLQGNDPTTWSIRRTFTDVGIINKDTLKQTKYGLLGLWNDGIYLFDGSVNRNITEKKLGRYFFTSLSDLSVCYAEFDGQKYFFYYASTGSTIDSCLVIDFAYHPEYRIYNDDFIAESNLLYKVDNTRYLAKGGYEYSEAGTETIVTSLQSGDKAFAGILKRKNLRYLYYDIDTSDEDVTVTIYCDGVSSQTITLNNSSRQRKRSDQLKNIEGYRFSIGITCSDSSDIKIYSPWALEATLVGD